MINDADLLPKMKIYRQQQPRAYYKLANSSLIIQHTAELGLSIIYIYCFLNLILLQSELRFLRIIFFTDYFQCHSSSQSS